MSAAILIACVTLAALLVVYHLAACSICGSSFMGRLQRRTRREAFEKLEREAKRASEKLNGSKA